MLTARQQPAGEQIEADKTRSSLGLHGVIFGQKSRLVIKLVEIEGSIQLWHVKSNHLIYTIIMTSLSLARDTKRFIIAAGISSPLSVSQCT